MREADGRYARTNLSSAGAPSFVKDASHQIYRVNATDPATGKPQLEWHLARRGVAWAPREGGAWLRRGTFNQAVFSLRRPHLRGRL